MNQKRFYPVIHCVDPDKQSGITHALENTRIARSNGADGVFLIGHDNMQFGTLIRIYENVRKHHPNFWIGINFLDIGASRNCINMFTATRSCVGLNGLWIDRLPDARLDLPGIEVFGGVAFKYIDPDLAGHALVIACEKAVRTVDVATTSGDATSSPPSVEKLKKISTLLGGRIPLAVASGVDASNASTISRYADGILVASSITERDRTRYGQEYLVPQRVREVGDRFRNG